MHNNYSRPNQQTKHPRRIPNDSIKFKFWFPTGLLFSPFLTQESRDDAELSTALQVDEQSSASNLSDWNTVLSPENRPQLLIASNESWTTLMILHFKLPRADGVKLSLSPQL